MKISRKTRFLSLFICAFMILSMLPAGAFTASAAEAEDQAVTSQEIDTASEAVEPAEEETIPEGPAEEAVSTEPAEEEIVPEEPAEEEMQDISAETKTKLLNEEPAPEPDPEPDPIISSWDAAHEFYYDANGNMVKGRLYTIDNDGTYYFQADGHYKKSDFATINGKYYYFLDNGKAASGLKKIGNYRYYFNPDTFAAKKGLVTLENGRKYFFSKNYRAIKGLKTIGKTRYYFSSTSNAALKGVVTTPSGAKYYFGDNYKALSGFHKDKKGRLYYFLPSTKTKVRKYAVSGLKKINGAKYYFDPKTKRAKKNSLVRLKSGSIYYFGKYGKAVSGEKLVKGKKYFFYKDTKRAVKNKWIRINGNPQYVTANGTFFVGYKKYKGKKYHMGGGGKLQYAMDKKAYSKSSRTNYLILVNLKECRVAVYRGSYHNWNRIKYFQCAPGTKKMPSPMGTYEMGVDKKGRSMHDELFIGKRTGLKFWFATRFYKSYLFHSVPCYVTEDPKPVANFTMGKSASHGCIRLEVENAKWIYDNIPKYTKCITYNGYKRPANWLETIKGTE